MSGDWKSIEEYDLRWCTSVLVTAKNKYGAWREPVSAFNDATEVWRVLGSRGGITPLSFNPTRFMPMPDRPKD